MVTLGIPARMRTWREHFCWVCLWRIIVWFPKRWWRLLYYFFPIATFQKWLSLTSSVPGGDLNKTILTFVGLTWLWWLHTCHECMIHKKHKILPFFGNFFTEIGVRCHVLLSNHAPFPPLLTQLWGMPSATWDTIQEWQRLTCCWQISTCNWL